MTLPPFQRLVDDFGPNLRRHIAAIGGVDEADDLVQETLIAALRAYPDLDEDANVKAWLWTIARNKVIDRHRATARRPLTVPLHDGSPSNVVDDDPTRSGDDSLWEAVRRLPPGQQMAVTLRFVDDLSYRQIGEMCDCSPGAARQRVYEGLTALRQEVDQ